MKREVRTVVVAEDAVVDSDEKELCSRSVSSYRIIACPNSDRKVLRHVSGNTTVIVELAAQASPPRLRSGLQWCHESGAAPFGWPRVKQCFSASFAQQRLWFLDQLEPGNTAYNLASAFRIKGSLDIDSLTRALQGTSFRRRLELSIRTFGSILPSRMTRHLGQAFSISTALLSQPRIWGVSHPTRA